MILRREKPDGTIVRLISRRTNQLIVTETRASKPFRALPRQVLDRIVGNQEKGIVGLDESKKFLVRYQDVVDGAITATRCWKCGTAISQLQPALRKVQGRGTNNAELVMVTVNGKEMLLGTMMHFNHFRQGLCTYLTPGRRLARFTYLHCADCTIKTEHAEDLLACLLGTPDWKRDLFRPYGLDQSDDEWAQRMFQWSGIELVGLEGPSYGPKELLAQAVKASVKETR